MKTRITPSVQAKERFCKDCNLPISVYKEPYFHDRLALYDHLYHCIDKWALFCDELSKYSTEQDYFEEYNRVKDEAINFIKNTKEYQNFNQEDMNSFAVSFSGIPSKDVYKQSNDGRRFISIDMKKANFSALRHYSPSIFDYKKTWEEFMSRFTSNPHIINSKYIRQVIMGNCNPGRQVTYEKCLMDMVVAIATQYVGKNKVVSFSNDEVILDITGLSDDLTAFITKEIEERLSTESNIPYDVELFTLHQIPGTKGYAKCITYPEEKTEFKCMNSYELPFVLRAYNKEEVQESDKAFYFEGKLAHFDEVPEIDLPFLKECNREEEKEM